MVSSPTPPLEVNVADAVFGRPGDMTVSDQNHWLQLAETAADLVMQVEQPSFPQKVSVHRVADLGSRLTTLSGRLFQGELTSLLRLKARLCFVEMGEGPLELTVCQSNMPWKRSPTPVQYSLFSLRKV